MNSSVKGENPKSQIHLPPALELLWAVIGLLLTIGCTFLKASIASPFWNWWPSGIHTQSLDVSFQIGAVLLTGCMGGKNAGALSQIAYLVLGLTGMQVFDGGGGIGYLAKPTFGYLLGFVPGAWVCGWLAFQTKRRLEFLALSCIAGLLMIHLAGLSALALKYSFQEDLLLPAALTYSLDPLPSQLAVVCAVTVLAFVLRLLMFY